MVDGPAPYPSEPDAASGFRMLFEEPIRRRPLISVDFEVLGVDINSDESRSSMSERFSSWRRTTRLKIDPPLGEFGCFFEHGIGAGL